MIKIERPTKPPKVFIEKGEVENKENLAAYDRSPEDYKSGQKRFEFNAKIYGSRTVKNSLLRAQHEKCCYCESKFRAHSPGDVEHYRPKGSVKQADWQRVEYPGYYWLAYDWNNLLVSCEICNRNRKKNLFPLKNPDTRARSHHGNIDGEQPLFVNPAIEDPRIHIRFRGESPVPRTKVGRKTIEGIGLRREALEEERRNVFHFLQVQCDIIRLGADRSNGQGFQALVKKAQIQLSDAVRPEAQYSSMALDLIKTLEGVRDEKFLLVPVTHS